MVFIVAAGEEGVAKATGEEEEEGMLAFLARIPRRLYTPARGGEPEDPGYSSHPLRFPFPPFLVRRLRLLYCQDRFDEPRLLGAVRPFLTATARKKNNAPHSQKKEHTAPAGPWPRGLKASPGPTPQESAAWNCSELKNINIQSHRA